MSSSLLIVHSSPRQCYFIHEDLRTFLAVKKHFFPEDWTESDFYFTCNSKIVQDEDMVNNGCVYHCVPRVLGGKGGFGSMLRAIGAQIEKTTSREACRDLSGRRMRDVNNEKKLKEWISKQADREREKEEKKQERLARRRAGPKHNFDDEKYVEQKSKVSDDLEDALKTGLQNPGPSSTVTSSDSHRKRKSPSETTWKAKKQKEWLGVDLDDLSSDDSDNNSVSGERTMESSDNSKDGENSNSGASCDIQAGAESAVPPSDSSQTCASDKGSESDSKDTEVKSDMNNVEGSARDEVKGETTQADKKTNTLLQSLPPPQSECKNDDKQDTTLEDIDLSEMTSAADLECLGLERLKFALNQRGLKCGGTLQQRAERLFSVKGLSRDQIDPALFPKASGRARNK